MRIKERDALRGLAALAVVLFHYTTQFEKLFGHSNELSWSMPYGDLGVHLFFMISGFVISRFSRLYPAYWLAIILTTAVVWTYGLMDLWT